MVISSSPARSNDHSLSAATRSTTSTGFIRRSPRNSMRDMPPPRFRGRVRTRTRPNDVLGSDAPARAAALAESPAQSTITASRPRAKMANGDSSRIHRYLRLLPHEAKFLSQMNGVETDSLVAGGGGNQRQVGEIGAIPL